MNTPITLAVGTRVYNHGDMANAPHFGTITEVRNGHIWIKPDPDSDREGVYGFPICLVAPVFKGHSGTRVVTEAAYKAWREAQLTGGAS